MNGDTLDVVDVRELTLEELLSFIWNKIATSSNKLIEAHSRFGYFKFQENLNPSLEDIVQGFEFIDFALKKLVDSGDLVYDELKIAINSRQCILKMRELAAACKNKAQEDYERVIRELKFHAN